MWSRLEWSINYILMIFYREYMKNKHSYLIDLDKLSCSCGKWDNMKFPCVHGERICRSIGDKSSYRSFLIRFNAINNNAFWYWLQHTFLSLSIFWETTSPICQFLFGIQLGDLGREVMLATMKLRRKYRCSRWFGSSHNLASCQLRQGYMGF